MLRAQIELTVNPKKMDEVLDVLFEDKVNALNASDVFNEFNIIQNKNKIEINVVCDSMDKLSEHMSSMHYRWHDLKKSGAIISQKHNFINL